MEYTYSNFLNLILIRHVSELARSLELTIWSDFIPAANWDTVLEKKNHSLLIAQFK